MTFPNRVAESPASGLDDSSFLAPSQQVVPQVGVWILIIAFTLDFLDSGVAASRWSSHFFPLSPPVHWCWQERRSSSGIIFQLERGGEGGNCRPLGILHWGCRGGRHVCNRHLWRGGAGWGDQYWSGAGVCYEGGSSQTEKFLQRVSLPSTLHLVTTCHRFRVASGFLEAYDKEEFATYLSKKNKGEPITEVSLPQLYSL